MRKILIGVIIFVCLLLVFTQWLIINKKVVGEVTSNDTSCLENKKYLCVLSVKDDQGTKYTIDYGGDHFCPLFGTRNSGFKGSVDEKIYTIRLGSRVEVYGQRVFDTISNHIKICGGAPVYYLKAL